MDLEQLRQFQTAARTENLSRAAEMLHMTQPNLSKSIVRLERELGVPLFEHRRGKISLNDYGRMFLASVEQALSQLDAGAASIRRLYDADQNVLALASTIDDFLQDVLKDFMQVYPHIGIRQVRCTPETMTARLLDRSLTLAITSREQQPAPLVFTLLGHKEYVVLLHRDNPLAARQGVWIRELAEQSFLCDASRMGLETLETLCRAQGFTPQVAHEVENSELIYRLLEANAGIAFMPVSQYAKLKTRSPDTPIRCLSILDPIPAASIGVVRNGQISMSPAAKCFVAFVGQWLEQEDRLLAELGLLGTP